MKRTRIKLIIHKSEALVLTKKRRYNKVTINIRSTVIFSSGSIKYLSLQLNNKLRSKENAINVAVRERTA